MTTTKQRSSIKRSQKIDDFCLLYEDDVLFTPIERNYNRLFSENTDDELQSEFNFEAIDFSKYDKVSDIPEFVRFAESRQWKKRRDFGYTWNADFFDFIRKIYKPWIVAAAKKGLVFSQADLLAVDKSLWLRLQQVDKKDVPAGLHLPTQSEANMEMIDNPEDRAKRELMREWWREQNAKRKAGALASDI